MTHFAYRLERTTVVPVPFDLRRTYGHRFKVFGLKEWIAREIEVRLAYQFPDLGVEVRFPEGTPAGPYDLAIAVAVAGGEQEGVSYVGNLNFRGEVLPVLGSFAFSAALPRLVLGVQEGVSYPNAVSPVKNWREAQNPRFQEPTPIRVDWTETDRKASDCVTPFEDLGVWGPLLVGRHSVSIVSRPGAGRTLLARRLASFLPITGAEAFEVAKASGCLGQFWTSPPFRAPHHTLSEAGCFGNRERIGEVGLAGHGVLFVDDASELRRPIFNRLIRECRREGVMLILGFSPCPCGQYGSERCRCLFSALRFRRDFYRTDATVTLDCPLFVDEERESFSIEPAKLAHSASEVRAEVAAARARMTESGLSIGAATLDDSWHFWRSPQ